MRLLIVGAAERPDLANWIAMLAGTGWDVHLFPVNAAPPATGLDGVTLHDSTGRVLPSPERGLVVRRLTTRAPGLRLGPRAVSRASLLAELIDQLEPDIVHSHGFPEAAYLCHNARRRVLRQRREFPAWLATGDDAWLYSRIPDHGERIRTVFQEIDAYGAMCAADGERARALGLRGEPWPIPPFSLGYDLDQMLLYRAPGPPSARRTIAVLGDQSWSGRGHNALRALDRCGDALRGYRLSAFALAADMFMPMSAMANRLGLELDIASTADARADQNNHRPLLGRSRVAIELSISDRLSPWLLDALAMGAFPVQSTTSCGHEWIDDGVTGALVPPEDPATIAAALLRAIHDDDLVDHASERNLEKLRERLGYAHARQQIITLYEKMLRQGSRRATNARQMNPA